MEAKKKHFTDLYRMVLADGTVHPKELETLYQIGLSRYGITKEEIAEVISSGEIFHDEPTTEEDKVKTLYELAQIAWADGKIEESEREMLRNYAIRYGVIEEQVNTLIDKRLLLAEEQTDVNEIINKL